MTSMPVDDTVLGLWQALSRRDWDAVKTFLSADCIYVDMPVGPTLAARGPDDIVKRLKVGLERWRATKNTADQHNSPNSPQITVLSRSAVRSVDRPIDVVEVRCYEEDVD